MSDHAAPADHSSHADPHASNKPFFDQLEVNEFRKDDGDAAKVIGKMLTSFFCYSLLVMMCVGYWTYRVTHSKAPAPTPHHEVDEE